MGVVGVRAGTVGVTVLGAPLAVVVALRLDS
jgi:hypothetical protein